MRKSIYSLFILLLVNIRGFAVEILIHFFMRYGSRSCWGIGWHTVYGYIALLKPKNVRILKPTWHQGFREQLVGLQTSRMERHVLCLACGLDLTKVLIYANWGFDGPNSGLVEERSDIWLLSSQLPQNARRENAFVKKGSFLLSHLIKTILGWHWLLFRREPWIPGWYRILNSSGNHPRFLGMIPDTNQHHTR